VGSNRRTRVVLVACALVATIVAAGVAGAATDGRSARDVTSGRSRLVEITFDAFKERPVAGVGIGGQPQASAEAAGRRSPKRSASHTTPLTVLAELGVAGFAAYLWLLGAVGWALLLVTRAERAFGLGLAAVAVALFVHSLLYAGFFEDPLTWGLVGLASAVLARAPAPSTAEEPAPDAPPAAPGLLAH
jgi:O-antigen ligase